MHRVGSNGRLHDVVTKVAVGAAVAAVGVSGFAMATGATTPASPTVTAVSPDSGFPNGGTSVTITGTNFTEVTAVSFGTTPAHDFTVDSATAITAHSPVSTGTVDVTVTTSGGTSAINAPADWFTFSVPSPTVTALSPASGPSSGGTSVTITGTNFTEATQVRFGAVAATTFTVNSDTSVMATSPSEPPGPVDISVTNGSGTSNPDRPADQFDFTIAPMGVMSSMGGTGLTTLSVTTQTVGDVLVVCAEVDSATPTVSSISGGGVTTWTRGVQFAGSGTSEEEIWFGPVTTTGTSTVSFTWTSPVTSDTTEYSAQEFSAGLGTSTAWALDTAGTLDNASSTTIAFPAATPAGSGELYFGYTVAGTTASNGSTPGFTYTATASGNITAYDPDVSGAVSPSATQTPAGTSSSVAVLLIVSDGAPPPAPTVTAVGPGNGATFGGDSVTITGTNLAGATGVQFGSVPATFFPVSATQVSAVSPPQSAGTVDVTVTTPGGTTAINAPADQFIYVAPPPPLVNEVSPSSGPAVGGSTVTITGNNFTGVNAVMFGTVAATTFIIDSGGLITAASPPGSGTVDVTVTNPQGTSAVNAPADQFTFVVPPPSPSAPTVGAVDPPSGPVAGGTSVTITGTNFTGATAVYFGASPAPAFTVDSATVLSATSPAGAAGTVDVTVVTPGGTSAAVPADRFTYQGSGYWMVGSDGSLFAFGGAPFLGSLPALGVHVDDIVAVVPTADSKGYWMIGSDGGVFAFGDAGFVGSLPGLAVHVHDVVGAVPTHDGRGYWMVGSDGGVFAFGDAGFVGSLPGLGVHVHDVAAVVPTATGRGYWMIGSDGGVFAFGDAGFVGSLPGLGVHVHDVVGAVPTGSDDGYWMIGSDGGVFAFGDAGFAGSLPGLGVHVHDVVGVVATRDGKGYWMVGDDGGVFAFGDAGFVGSLPGLGIAVHDIVAFARQ